MDMAAESGSPEKGASGGWREWTLSFTYTDKEFSEGLNALHKKQFGRILTKPAYIVFVVILFGLMLGMPLLMNRINPPAPVGPLVVRPPASQPARRVVEIVVKITPYVLIFLLIWLFFLRGLGGKVRQQNARFFVLRTYRISREGVAFSGAHVRSEFEWEAFIGWSESKSLILLYETPTSAHLLPKRAFASEEDLAAFRGFLGEILCGPGERGFPVQAAG